MASLHCIDPASNKLKEFAIDLGPHVAGLQAYRPFLHLRKEAAWVLTNSGCLQKKLRHWAYRVSQAGKITSVRLPLKKGQTHWRGPIQCT